MAGPQAPQATPSAVVAWARDSNWESYFKDRDSPIVLDTVAADVPALTELLTTGTDSQRLGAAQALGYGGGDAGIAVLRANPDAARSGRAMLGIAIAYRGSAADIDEMIQLLDQTGGDGHGWPTTDMMLTLGALKVTAAIPALERRRPRLSRQP
jgi:hypothetical protein